MWDRFARASWHAAVRNSVHPQRVLTSLEQEVDRWGIEFVALLRTELGVEDVLRYVDVRTRQVPHVSLAAVTVLHRITA